MINTLDAALSYVRHGWKLCFTHPKDKNPGSLMGRGWQKKLAGTEAEVRSWLNRYPDANIGLSLGPDSGVIDVEFDSAEGEAVLDELLQQDPGDPTPTYRSAKSIHRLYRFDGDLPKQTVRRYKGVEFRINALQRGLQSILPPSVHVSGKRYEWLEGRSPADVGVTSMPFAMWDFVRWLSENNSTADAGEYDEDGDLWIPEGHRHHWMLKRLSAMRHWGFSRSQLRQMAETLDTEVAHFDSEDREKRLDDLVNWCIKNIKPEKVDLPEPTYAPEVHTGDVLLSKQIRRDWIVQGFMVDKEPMIIGGASKSLKTSVALDLAVSISTGTKFLGTFEVPKPRSVMVISGESGELTIQKFLKCLVQERGLQADDLKNLHLSYQLPKLDDPKHVDDLIALLKNRGIGIVVLDPLYRSLRVGESASNVYSMGEKLELIAERIHRAGITVVLCHHFRKQGRTYDEAPDLEDLSQSGVAEFGRQFLLLKRRVQYQMDGTHVLWFKWGGSAGHQGQRILEATTGTVSAVIGEQILEAQTEDEQGLCWKTHLWSVSQWEKRWKEERAEQREEEKQELRSERQEAILEFLREDPGSGVRDIKAEIGGSSAVLQECLTAMEELNLVSHSEGARGKKCYFVIDDLGAE